jgi:cell division transport system permease protein
VAYKISGRFRSASLTTVVSITLVLFILGLLALLILNGRKISRNIKETADVEVFFNTSARDADIAKLQKMLDVSDYVKSYSFITKDSAAKLLMQSEDKDEREDFTGILGYNPLPASINVHLKADYVNEDSISFIVKQISAYPQVKEVLYQKKMIDFMNRNISKIGLIMFGFSILLLVVSLALINNTIRLAIYSKRLLIKTMQLVGATPGFIRRPYLMAGIRNGIVASLVALLMILPVARFVQSHFPYQEVLDDMNTYLILSAIVLSLGIIISWISTYFALRKYLRLKADDLHY